VESGAKELTVCIIHSLPLKTSVVQIFVEDQMALVAHLVDRQTIGKPDYYLGVKVKVNCVSNKSSDNSLILNFYYTK